MSTELDKLPDISFVPKTVDEIQSSMIAVYEQEYEKQTGEAISLPAASRNRIILNTASAFFFQGYQLIDFSAKMNLLKYSTGNYLDHVVAFLGVKRLDAQKAVTKMQFTLSMAQDHNVAVPAGTRVSTANQLFFETDADCVIPAGQLTVECSVTCTAAGTAGNNCAPGQINVLVDPVPFVSKVSNTEMSQGGMGEESDDSLRQRAYLKPNSFSTAGPDKAYEYFVREYSQAIEGVGISRPSAGVVDIRITLTGGELPTATFCGAVKDHLDGKRPMTDDVTVQAPTAAEYAVQGTYYISSADASMQQTIQEKVEAALQEYLLWQSGKIGRDITPDKLISLVYAAGAKRLTLTSPSYAVTNKQSIAKNKSAVLTCGGLEDE